MLTENRSSNTEMVSVPFQREDRYIVIKRSDLKKVPVNYRSALVDPMLSLLSHLPHRECLVIESDWPEYEPTWAAIEARVAGKSAQQHQGEPVPLPANMHPHDFDNLPEAHCNGWNACLEEIAKLGPLYSRPVQGEPVLWRYRKNAARSWFYTVQKRSAEIALRDGYIVEEFYTHADTGEVERLVAANTEFARRHLEGLAEVERLRAELGYMREERDDLSGKLDRFYSRTHGIKNLAAIEELSDKLAERDALLRDCFTAMLKGGYSKPLRKRIKAALSASAEREAHHD
ncbi:hypothetical protein [Pseudomonas sp. Marseille-P9655]|uniref:hypothetical protein n=1 Tax=Pseudomonas sp. Marseille-P9655 TaxID=2866591 RepID=UPI001CE421F2|nr:hypothetical protein [Pseudomonas sp. Marseille-P9655]